MTNQFLTEVEVAILEALTLRDWARAGDLIGDAAAVFDGESEYSKATHCRRCLVRLEKGGFVESRRVPSWPPVEWRVTAEGRNELRKTAVPVALPVADKE